VFHRSSSLTPVNVLLGGYMKSVVYESLRHVNNTETLKRKNTVALESTKPEIFRFVCLY
jgi:hypothetical protein